MSKTVKNSLIVIAIVIILFGIIWFVYDIFKKEPVETKVNANLADGNAGLDNIINDLFENTIENEVVENIVDNEKNTIVGNTQKQENKDDKKDKNEDEEKDVTQSTTESVTTREEKAVELVKKEWGSTDGVYFSNESVDSNGRYIVSVRDKKTTASLAFYLVDVDKRLVTEQ